MIDKINNETPQRTFESRVKFLNEIFSNPYTKEEILASSVQFKLNKSYEQYLDEVNKSFDALLRADSTRVLQKIK